MLKAKRLILATLAPIFVMGDAMTTYFVLSEGKGNEVNVMMSPYDSVVIFTLNLMFALIILMFCIYLDRKLSASEIHSTFFVAFFNKGRSLCEADKLVFAYATLLTIAIIRLTAMINNFIVFNSGEGLINWFSMAFNITNYKSMIMVYGLMFFTTFPLAVNFVATMYSSNIENRKS